MIRKVLMARGGTEYWHIHGASLPHERLLTSKDSSVCIILSCSDARLRSQSGRGRGQSLQGHKNEQVSNLCLWGPWGSGRMSTKFVALWVHHAPSSSSNKVLAPLASQRGGYWHWETEVHMPIVRLTGRVTRGK